MIKYIIDFKQWLLCTTCVIPPDMLIRVAAPKSVIKQLKKDEAKFFGAGS